MDCDGFVWIYVWCIHMCLGIKKRDRYAMRPDKVWRSTWLKQMLLPKQYDSFDKYVMFCYKKDTATQSKEK